MLRPVSHRLQLVQNRPRPEVRQPLLLRFIRPRSFVLAREAILGQLFIKVTVLALRVKVFKHVSFHQIRRRVQRPVPRLNLSHDSKPRAPSHLRHEVRVIDVRPIRARERRSDVHVQRRLASRAAVRFLLIPIAAADVRVVVAVIALAVAHVDPARRVVARRASRVARRLARARRRVRARRGVATRAATTRA